MNRNDTQPRLLSKDAFDVLEVIVQHNIGEISYKHPEKTLSPFFPGNKTTDPQAYYTVLIQEINTTANRDALEPNVKYRIGSWEIGTRYLVDTETVTALYEQQKAARAAKAEEPTTPKPV